MQTDRQIVRRGGIKGYLGKLKTCAWVILLGIRPESSMASTVHIMHEHQKSIEVGKVEAFVFRLHIVVQDEQMEEH